jgi:exonuclease III
MKAIFWNIRSLNMPGRMLGLESLIREYRVDFVGIQETKKEDFAPAFLKILSCPVSFIWEFLPAKKTTGGILLGVREDTVSISNVCSLKYSISCMVLEKKTNLSWLVNQKMADYFNDWINKWGLKEIDPVNRRFMW